MYIPTRRQTFFLPVGDGQRLCVYYPPQGKCRGRVLFVPPLAEELNKSRRMVTLQAVRLSTSGFAVLTIDPLGCGDSSGDFGDAGWQAWLDDLANAHAWLAREVQAVDWLWGLRAGCLLANELRQRLALPAHLLFWQPQAQGRQVLQQFLRLRTLGALLEGASDRGDGQRELLAQLEAGESLEIAGYRLSPLLAAGLERSQLQPAGDAARFECLELSAREGVSCSPAIERLVERWSAAGWQVRARVVSGPAFWQTSEIEDAPALIDATLASLNATAAEVGLS